MVVGVPLVWGEHLFVPGEDLCVYRHKSPSMLCQCVTFQINVMVFLSLFHSVSWLQFLSESVCTIK